MLAFTNLHAVTQDFSLHQAVLDNDMELVEQLLNEGAAIDTIGSRKYGYGSALHLAVREGHLEVAKLLLQRGAEVDVLDPDDLTPLHNAAWNGNLDMAELLLDAGADIEASTYDGDTPLSLAQNNDQAQVVAFIQAKLQPSATGEINDESVATNDSGVIDVSGTYITTRVTYPSRVPRNYQTKYFFGDGSDLKITIKQSGNAITGAISGNVTGEFKGVINGREITIESSLNARGYMFLSGEGTLLASNDGETLTGSYRLYSRGIGNVVGGWNYGDVTGDWIFRKIE